MSEPEVPEDAVEMMRGLRADLQSERRKRIRGRVIFAVYVVGSLLLLNGLRVTVDQQAKDRRDNRIAACGQDNTRITQHDKLVDSVEGLLAAADTPNPNRTPAQQAAVDAFFSNAHAKLESARVEMRDCSIAGIDLYLTPSTTTSSG